jgi:hypothetical protein
VACTYPGGGRNVEGASRLAHYGRQSGTLSSKKTKKGNRSRKIYLPTRSHQGSAQDKLALAHVARDLEALVRQLSEEAQLFLQDVTLISRKTLHYTFILCLYYISAT